jgi:hypothetical protein
MSAEQKRDIAFWLIVIYASTYVWEPLVKAIVWWCTQPGRLQEGGWWSR